MNRVGVSEVLARANAALVGPDLDLTGALASLLSGTIRVLPADAAAVLVDCDGRLEVLAATSHQAAEIELHQAQAAEGPCLDALRSGRVGGGCGAHVLADLWPLTGPAIIRAGYQCVMAIPLRWQGTTFGALNVFRMEPIEFRDRLPECRALGDSLTLVLAAGHLNVSDLREGLRAVLKDRAVIEQAKGVLAQTGSLTMSDAYLALVGISDAEGVTLGVAARQLIQRARTAR